MMIVRALLGGHLFLLSLFVQQRCQGFPLTATPRRSTSSNLYCLEAKDDQGNSNDNDNKISSSLTRKNDNYQRRTFFKNAAVSTIITAAVGTGLLIPSSSSSIANAAVGSLPEFADTNAILQGITVTVADKSQQDAMIQFCIDAFDMKVLRQRVAGPITDTWLGYGPEQFSIPNDFTTGVSSFAKYGGHASLHLKYNANSLEPTYKTGDDTSKQNVAYLQAGVPTYRISQMVKYGGNVLDAYGIVNVISPSGLPIRGIVGIRPDPIMLVAINCQNVEQSAQFYRQLGFVEQPYPFARPGQGTGQFEPPQPSKSVYLAPSPNSMGILLLQNKDKRKAVVANKSIQGLEVIYTPSSSSSTEETSSTVVTDPSYVSIQFTSIKSFEDEEQSTRVVTTQE